MPTKSTDARVLSQNADKILSTVSVGVLTGERSVSTRCPHCQEVHEVILTRSREMKAPLRERRAITPTGASENDSTDATKPQTLSHDERSGRVAPRPRFRYFAVDRRKHPKDLSDARAKVYRYVEKSGGKGIIARELVAKGIPHGTVQQTLNWLRHNELVRSEEEASA